MTVNPHPGVGSSDPEVFSTGPIGPVPQHHGGDLVRCGVPGVGEFRALWVDETTLAWPGGLFPRGAGAGGVCFSLVCSPDGSVRLEDGVVRLGDRGFEVPLRVVDGFDEELVEAHPWLADYVGLSVVDEWGAAHLERADVEVLVRGQVVVVQRAGGVGGWVSGFTGVQVWPVVDRLWGRAASVRDGSAPLGADFVDGAPRFALWAPTALSVALLAWDTGDASGSAGLVEGEPVRLAAVRRRDGRWEVDADRCAGAGVGAGAQYLWEVEVFAASSGRVEVNRVTDPYSAALTVDSRRSVAVDLGLRELKPASWCENLSPVVECDAGRVIYELHVREFSVADAGVEEGLRGTYGAFAADSTGAGHLRELVRAGVDTVQLLPVFDFASVPEERSRQRTARVPAGAWGASRAPQAAVSAVAGADAYGWGRDPWHWMAPEGSYAREGHQDGGARVREVRAMVGALHGMGVQVLVDQVFGRVAAWGQERGSVLDRVVPGYYHRLDEAGAVVESGGWRGGVDTGRAMGERLMIDACVAWVRDYRVDGLRLDLMGCHGVETMARLRRALDEVCEDAVGHRVYLYGQGWDAPGACGPDPNRARQGRLGALGIGALNDRVRDGINGGGFAQVDPRTGQGLGNGELTDPNELESRDQGEVRADLAWRSDLVRLSLAGNVRGMEILASDGRWLRGDEVGYGSSPAAYGDQPADSVAYVSSYEGETLFDRLTYKLPASTSMADRVRMNTVCLAMVALGQSPCLWAGGSELLRSKSLDACSCDSGDHFNAIDWSGRTNGWGRGLPPAGRNFDRWVIQAGLLARPDLTPSPSDIASARAQALDLLRAHRSTPLLCLGRAGLVRERVSFPMCGPGAQPGVIIMVIDDGAGEGDIDPALDGVLVVINATPREITQRLDTQVGRLFTLCDAQAQGADPIVKTTRFDPTTGTVKVPARTAAILIEH